MATFTIGNKTMQYSIASSGNTYVLGSGNYVNAPDIGIYEASTYHDNTLQLDGAVSAEKVGIHSGGTNTLVHIGAYGSVTAANGIYTYGSKARIVVDGTVTGATYSAYVSGAANGSLTNNGTMDGRFHITKSANYTMDFGKNSSLTAVGDGVALDIDSASGETYHVTNLGTISGATAAIWGMFGVENVVNKGTLSGGVTLADGDDVLDNRGGTITGKINLGSDNDRFDNRGGHVDSAVSGGFGNDTYVLDSEVAIIEAIGRGIDTVKSGISINFNSAVLTGQELENLTLFGTKAINGTGNALNNTITGNAAANKINGGVGDDTMKGGDGSDTYYADTAADKVLETNADKATGGTDKVYFSGLKGSFTLGANVENLTLTGTHAINGTGNGLANAILGNADSNTISGAGGNDRLDGAAGTDILTGGSGADTFVFKTGYGKDTVTDFENGTDHFDLKSWDAITDFADLKAHHLSVSGNDLVIHAGTDILLIKGTAKAELDAGDFLF